MSDFFKIDTRPGKRGVTEIYPKFIVGKPNDLMIRGSDFYAIWMEERGLWSTDEQDVIRTIDRELRTYADEYQKTHDKYDSVTGAKDYRWLESEMVYNLHLEDTIDRSYFDKMATKAIEAISEYGDFEQFASNDSGEPPWQKPDIPWDDVQDEAAQNFDVR